MIPNHFVELEKIPLTVNGKVNKKMLPSVEGLEVSSGVEYIAPRNEIEEDLATLWKEHFEVDQVGIKSDYFQLGGDSIKMIRFISDINKLFNLEFPIATFYENPTIEGISSFIATQENNSSFTFFSLLHFFNAWALRNSKYKLLHSSFVQYFLLNCLGSNFSLQFLHLIVYLSIVRIFYLLFVQPLQAAHSFL